MNPKARYAPRRILARTDAEALASDWQAVGDDMRRAMVKVYEQMTPEQQAELRRRLSTTGALPR